MARGELGSTAQAARRGRTDRRGKSVTRMLADAGLLVQQATGISTEPLVVAGGRDSIIEAADGAGLLVLGLSDRWRREGLGTTRSAIAGSASAPVLFVRRGTRPGLFAPKENVTQFRWSMAGGPSGLLGSLAGRPARRRRPRDRLARRAADLGHLTKSQTQGASRAGPRHNASGRRLFGRRITSVS